MENFFTAEIIWFLIGLLLLLLELVVPGLVLVFFGIGAWITAGVCLLFPGAGVNVQLLVFLSTSLLSLALLRRVLLRRHYTTRSRGDKADLEDEYIGRPATALEDFGPGTDGRVSFKGSTWAAASRTPVARGQQVVITGFESIRLIVEPVPATML